MKSRTIRLSALFLATLVTLGGCSSSKVAPQATTTEPVPADVSQTTSPSQGTQQPGGDPSMGTSQGVIQNDGAHPIDPAAMSTPSNSSQPPRPDLNQGGTPQGGSPVSDSPVQLPPQRGQGTQTPGGRPPSESPAGDPASMQAQPDMRKSMVEAALRGKPGLENVTVMIGGDGCAMLDGTVKTAEKKEEAAAIARGALGGSCVVNRITVQ